MIAVGPVICWVEHVALSQEEIERCLTFIILSFGFAAIDLALVLDPQSGAITGFSTVFYFAIAGSVVLWDATFGERKNKEPSSKATNLSSSATESTRRLACSILDFSLSGLDCFLVICL